MHALTRVLPGAGVAFGRPKMSVWGHAGAGSAPAKVACNSFVDPFFGTFKTLNGGPQLHKGRICAARSRSRSQDAGARPEPDSPCTGSQSGSATRDRGGNKQASIFSTLTPRPVMCASEIRLY